MDIIIDEIPHGDYAISIIHDKNQNKKMDMKWFPYPHPGELSGTSNNATATIGPPSFADAKFSLKEAVKSMRIKLTN